MTKKTIQQRHEETAERNQGVNAVIRGKGNRKKFTTIDKGKPSEFSKFMGDFLRSGRPRPAPPQANNKTPNTKMKLRVATLSKDMLIEALKETKEGDQLYPYFQREARRRQARIDRDGGDE